MLGDRQCLLECWYAFMHFETRVRVRYEETDRMGVVYHANYFAWFEVGRVEMLRALGISYRALEDSGWALTVIDCAAEFRKSAQFDDELLVRARVVSFNRVRVKIAYEISRGEELLATGHTTHAVLERKTCSDGAIELRPARAPEFLTSALSRALTKET